MDDQEQATSSGEPNSPPKPPNQETAFTINPAIEVAWRERAKRLTAERAMPIEIQLPSGMTVMAIRASLRWLFNMGRIPDPLLAGVEEMIALIEAADPDEMASKLQEQLDTNTVEEFGKFMAVLNGCWLACVTQPLFSDDPKREGAEFPPYYIGDQEYFDKLYLYQWAQGVDESIIDFFQQQGEVVGMLANGEGVQLSTESDLRIDRLGRFVDSDHAGSSGFQVGELHSRADRRANRSVSKKGHKKANRVR